MELFEKTDPNWPPHPREIDLHDGSWLNLKQAAFVVNLGERSMQRWHDEGSASIKIRGRIWFKRDRLFMQEDR